MMNKKASNTQLYQAHLYHLMRVKIMQNILENDQCIHMYRDKSIRFSNNYIVFYQAYVSKGGVDAWKACCT